MTMKDQPSHSRINRTRSSLMDRLHNPDDHTSWQTFYNLYSNLVFSVALKAGLTSTEAEEVRQETFIVAFKKMTAPANPENSSVNSNASSPPIAPMTPRPQCTRFEYKREAGRFRNWLLKTTSWRIADQFRKRQPQLTPLKNPGFTNRSATVDRIPASDRYSLDALWEEEFENNLLATALRKIRGQISAKQFQIFDRYVLKQRPVREVAQMLGVSETGVYLAKCRISKLLKNELTRLKSLLP